ncbi:TetR/AcrR family transcriptional regulator [Paenibacillus sp. SC116]|uniref:TetR/AcrR family transcriptional regulator n=1 Tax=Paenibacillus sp. SC116 TaxID=2968986 RepID=UPI00215B5AFF|nr:TetR/AcrR family transcriptional regulator [Paenibacillus sp. SC116]MCR8842364.1 TetR/AcrR family transcriptional regulator [Paenibacillus sp. SC116]
MPLQRYDKEKVLEACMSVFAQHGYKNTSTIMLAEAADISKALIFHHFKSKKNLYLSLMEHCITKIRFKLGVDAIIEHGNFFEVIEKITLLKFDYYRKYPTEYKFVFEAFYAVPEELKKEIEERYGIGSAERYQLLEQLFEKVPLKDGVDRNHAFELLMIAIEHFDKKFISEVTDIEAIDEEYGPNFLKEMNLYHRMIRLGIAK